MENVIYSDIECYIKSDIEKIGDNTYKISSQVLIANGFGFNGNYESYFGSNCTKDYVKDLLEIETKHSEKFNKQMIFTEKDKLHHEANNNCNIYSKTLVNKVRDQSLETGKYRGSTYNICNLKYRQQNFIPVIFHNNKDNEFKLLFNELFEKNGGGKSRCITSH